ncbi:DUF3575 domain-containing protein [Winogradskyella poriferorum]|uniref:DUF3575 domain-containing protein n=1 Tax=Winogradskyella poriferorum TaxID=307627 RepID=UPI003D65F637
MGCLGQFIFAQESVPKEWDNRKNQIGVSVSDMVNGALQLEYERLIMKNVSFSFGFGYKGDNGLIRFSGLNGDQIKTNDLTYSGVKFIPAVRYYIKSTTRYSMDGFYVGTYAKFTNYKSNLDGTYLNDQDESFLVAFDADFSVLSVGLMIGYKLPISKRLTLDFLIIGPGRGFHNYEIENKSDLPEEFYEDLNEALDDYPIFDFVNADFRFSDVRSKTKFNAVTLRYGITLGYSF